MDQAWLVAQQAEIEAIKAEIEGMRAYNEMYESKYTQQAFQDKADAIRAVANLIMQNR